MQPGVVLFLFFLCTTITAAPHPYPGGLKHRHQKQQEHSQQQQPDQQQQRDDDTMMNSYMHVFADDPKDSGNANGGGGFVVAPILTPDGCSNMGDFNIGEVWWSA